MSVRFDRLVGGAVLPLAALTLTLVGEGTSVLAMDERAGSVDSLVARVVEAYGGRERLDSVVAYMIDARLTPTVRRGEATSRRVYERPSRLRIRIDYPSHTEERLLNGQQGWRSGPGGRFVPVNGPLLGAMVLQAARSDLPWLLYQSPSPVTEIAHPDPDSELIVLQVEIGQGLFLRAHIDPASYHIVRSESVLHGAEFQTTFATGYSDFRYVDGVLFAFTERNEASGMQTGITRIREILLNPELPDDAFVPQGVGPRRGP